VSESGRHKPREDEQANPGDPSPASPADAEHSEPAAPESTAAEEVGGATPNREDDDVLPREFEEALEEVVEEVVGELVDETELRRVARQVIYSRIESTEGAFPPPGMLEQYERIHPGFTRELMDEFRAEGNNRRSLMRRDLSGQIAVTIIGQVFAFLIALAGLGLGAYLIHDGRSIAGYAVLVTAVGGIVGSFLYLQKGSAPADHGPPAEVTPTQGEASTPDEQDS
jgi:uncharacterized membrane protein